MAYKMKGNPFTKGTIQGTKGHRSAIERLKLARSGYESRPDGRAKSSAFQLTEEEKAKIKWEKEQEVSRTVKPNEMDGETTTVGYETKGTSKGFKAHSTPGEAFTNWKKKNPSGTEEDYIKEASDWREEQRQTHTKTREEVSDTSKEKKKCECQTYKTDGSKGPMVTHECGKPNPNCGKRPEPNTCSCTPKGGEPISYPCGEEKPVACRSKGAQKNADCPPSKQKSCGKNRFWSWSECGCKRRDKAKKVRVKKRKLKSNCIGKKCVDAYGGIVSEFSPK